jgi:hypothetical protein
LATIPNFLGFIGEMEVLFCKIVKRALASDKLAAYKKIEHTHLVLGSFDIQDE